MLRSKIILALLDAIEILLFAGIFILLPLIDRGELMNSNQAEKFFFFYAMLAAILLYKLIKSCLLNEEIHFKVTWVDILVLLFFIYVIANRFLVADFFSHSRYLFEFIGLGLFYLLVRLTRKNLCSTLLISLITAGVVQALYGNLQLYGIFPSHHSLFKITGGFFNPGPYAGYLSSVLPIVLALYLFHAKQVFHFRCRTEISLDDLSKTTRGIHGVIKSMTIHLKEFISKYGNMLMYYFYVVSLILIAVILPATQSRGAWLAVLFSGVYLLFKRYNIKASIVKKYLNSKIKIIFGILLLFITLGGLSYTIYQFKIDSANGRLLIWKNTLDMIKDKPLLGWGFEKFPAHYMNYQENHFKTDINSSFADVAGEVNYAFNEFLKIGSETGVFGLLIALGIIVAIFTLKDCPYESNNKVLFLAAKGSLLAVVIFGLFSYPSNILPIKLNFIFLLAIASGYKEGIRMKPNVNGKILIYSRILLFAVILTFTLSVYPFFKKWHQAYEDWRVAFYTYQLGAWEASVTDFEKAKPLLAHNGQFLVNYGKALSMAGKHSEAIAVLLEARNYLQNTILCTAMGDSYKALGQNHEAEMCYLQAWHMIPSRFYPKYLLAVLYDATGKKEDATKIANELILKEPKIESTAVDEIKVEMAKIIEKNKISDK